MKSLKELLLIHSAIVDISTVNSITVHMPEIFYTSEIIRSIAENQIAKDKNIIKSSIKYALEQEAQKLLLSAKQDFVNLMDNYGEYERQAN